MSSLSICPDFSSYEIPMDEFSKPFWQATSEHSLLMPRCTSCGVFRWPIGPFCPSCRTQSVEWVAPGQAFIYSYTIMPVMSQMKDAETRFKIAVLIEFAAAPGVRLVSTLVDAPIDEVRIDAAVDVDWLTAANAIVPVFRLAADDVARPL